MRPMRQAESHLFPHAHPSIDILSISPMSYRGRSRTLHTDELARRPKRPAYVVQQGLFSHPAEPYYIQEYLEQKGEGQPFPEEAEEEELMRPRRRRPPLPPPPPPPRVPRSQLAIPLCPSPQPRSACLFPLDESELAAVRSMWLRQGRRGLSLLEGLVRPVQAQEEEVVESLSSMSSTAPSALFDAVSVSSEATTMGTLGANKTVAPRSPSRSRTTTALVPSRYTLVSPDQSPLHGHAAQAVLAGVLKEEEERRRLSEEKRARPPRRRARSVAWSLADLLPLSLQGAPPPRRRARSVSDASMAWLRPLPSHRRPPHDDDHHHHPQAQRAPEQTLIHLLPLPLHPRPPHRTPVIPPIRTLPRSPYRPLTPPATPTPRIRIVPNPQFLRLKALQNRVLWGLVPVDRGECEVLRRVGIGMRRSGPEDVDREGRMCSGREAKVGVAVEGRPRRVLADMAAAVDEAEADGGRPTVWWGLKWVGM